MVGGSFPEQTPDLHLDDILVQPYHFVQGLWSEMEVPCVTGEVLPLPVFWVPPDSRRLGGHSRRRKWKSCSRLAAVVAMVASLNSLSCRGTVRTRRVGVGEGVAASLFGCNVMFSEPPTQLHLDCIHRLAVQEQRVPVPPVGGQGDVSALLISLRGQSMYCGEGLDRGTGGLVPPEEFDSEIVDMPDSAGGCKLSDVLPSEMAEMYQSADWLMDNTESWETIVKEQRAYCGVNSKDYVKLVQKLMKREMVVLREEEPMRVTPPFGVWKVKSDGTRRIRLILDCRRVCRGTRKPAPFMLPNATWFAKLVIGEDEKLLFHKSDLSDYFFNLAVPEEWQRVFGMPGISREEWEKSGCDMEFPSKHDKLWPCMRVLVMGWSHSPLLAQAAHMECVRRMEPGVTSYALSPELDSLRSLAVEKEDNVDPTDEERIQDVLKKCVPTMHPSDVATGDMCHVVCIDDRVDIGVGVSADKLQEVRQRYQAGIENNGMLWSAKKSTPTPEEDIVALGMALTNSSGVTSVAGHTEARVEIPAERMIVLRQMLRSVTARKRIRPYLVEKLMGHVTWAALASREAFAIFDRIYPWMQRYRKCRRAIAIPNDVRKELLIAEALCPLWGADIRAPIDSTISAVDASGHAIGVCTTESFEPETLRGIYGLSQVQGEHARLDGSDLVTPTTIRGIPAADLTSVVDSATWRTTVSCPVRHTSDHINQKEMLVHEVALRKRLKDRSTWGRRHIILGDSRVCTCALAKGRSSSWRLRPHIQRIAALQFATGARLAPVWISTRCNPADSPSREVRWIFP